MIKDEVSEYTESLKDPKKLLEYCKKYHERNPRDIDYVFSRSIVSKDPNNICFLLAGATIFIKTWNLARFQRLPTEVKANLENDILEAYKKSKEKLEELKGKRLECLDLSDNKLGENIKSIFSVFSSKESIGFTGASKILHLLNPYVFMMWDIRIRNAYHSLHGKNHKVGDSECYLEFLKQSQQTIKAILSKMTEDDLWNSHLTFLDKEFMEAFSFRESMLKMLDECNWVRFKPNSGA
jgi:hypothetical protein